MLYCKTGTYTGTGAGTQDIAVPFVPKTIIVYGPDQATATSFIPQIAIDTMSSGSSGGTAATTFFSGTGNITLSVLGFTAGGTGSNGLNISAKVYYWIALGGDEVMTGSYTGDTTDSRNITGLPFDPDLVFVRSEGSANMLQKSSSTGRSTDTSAVFEGSYTTNRIQRLQTGGFQIGSNTGINAAATVYHYVALKKSEGLFYEGTYTGDASDNRSITGVGFQPNVVMIKSAAASVRVRVRTVEAGDNTGFLGISNQTADAIQAFETDGFQIGTSTTLNDSGIIYYYFAWRENVPLPDNGQFFSIM
jgi:hypothetical protein